MTIIKPNQIKFALEGKIYNSGKDQDMAMITISNIDDFDFDGVYIAVIALPKTSFVFNNKGRAVADPASDLRADAIAAA